ncbi:MAG: hypothetical protein JWR48_2860 [Mycobacterium sp.]|jgi:hypothetical protein|nr:hypothetical protein [Mycobacterium sp.]
MWNTRRAAPHRCQMVTLAWFGGRCRAPSPTQQPSATPTAFSPTSMPTRNASPLLFKNRQLALRLLTGLAAGALACTSDGLYREQQSRLVAMCAVARM